MASNKNSILKIGTIYTLSSLLVKGISFLTTPIFARAMSQPEFGQYSSITSWINILVTVVTLDLYAAVSVAKYDYNENMDEYLSSSLLFGNIVTLAFYAIAELNMPIVERLLAMEARYVRIMFAYLLFFPASQLLLAKYRIYNEYKQVILVTLTSVAISVAAQILLVFLMSDKLFGRFFGAFGIASIVNVVLWFIIVLKGRKFSFRYIKHALSLALPLIPHVLAGVLLGSSDRVMINSICGSTDAALYSLAYTVSSIANIFLVSINQAWVPWMYDRMENGRTEIRNVSKIYSIIVLIFCSLLMLTGPEIVLIFGGKEYYGARYVIAPVVMAIMFQFVYTQYVNIEFYRKKNIWISIATIVATLINIGLNFVLLPKFGYLVAAYTTIIGYLFMVLLHYFVVKTKTRDIDLFDEKFFGVVVIVAAVNMLISLVTYMNAVYRFAVISVYLIVIVTVLVKYREDIKRVISKILKAKK